MNKTIKHLATGTLASVLIGLLTWLATGLWIAGTGAFLITLLVAITPETFGLGRTKPSPLDDDTPPA